MPTAVAVGVDDGVSVLVIPVPVGELVAVADGVSVEIGVCVAVGVTLGVCEGKPVAVGVAVVVEVAVGVKVGVPVAVNVGVASLAVSTINCGAAAPSRDEKVTPSLLSATKANV